VMEAVQWLEKHDATKHNIRNMSAAKLGVIVLGALGGKKTNANINDFLPFDTRRMNEGKGITRESLEILRSLMKTRVMDGRVIALLADDLKTHSDREEQE